MINNSRKNERMLMVLNLCLQGNKNAIEETYTFLRRECIKIAKYYLYKKGVKVLQAEDIAQNVCMKLLEGGLAKYNANAGRLDTWLKRIVKNELYNMLRVPDAKHLTYCEHDSQSIVSVTKGLHSSTASADELAKTNELKYQIDKALSLLSEQDKMLMTEVEIKGERVKDVASNIGQNANWISGRLALSRKKMFNYLNNNYHDDIEYKRNVYELHLYHEIDKNHIYKEQNESHLICIKMAA